MTQVYWDADRKSLFVSGLPHAYPPLSLMAARTGDMIAIWSGPVCIASIRYSRVRDRDNAVFASAEEVMAYLETIFSQDPNAPTAEADVGDLTLIFDNRLI